MASQRVQILRCALLSCLVPEPMYSALILGLGGHLTVISIRRTGVGPRSCLRSASSQSTGLCSEPLVSPLSA